MCEKRNAVSIQIFLKHYSLIETESASVFRRTVLTEIESTLNVTHSSACSLYNTAKKTLIENKTIKEFIAKSAPAPRKAVTAHKPTARLPDTKEDELFEDIREDLEQYIIEENSWKIVDSNNQFVCFANSMIEASGKIKTGQTAFRVEELEEF